MRAYANTEYGPPEVIKVVELPKPDPRPNDVLIKIHATTVSSGDWRARSLTASPGMGLIMRLVFGVFGPRKQVLGTELSGVIDAVGDEVTRIEAGQEVVGFPGGSSFGAYAEYVLMSESGNIVPKPKNLSFEEAAAICFGGTAAYDFLNNKGKLKAGDNVLVNGASGSTGTACVQIAKHFGAEVTGVCCAGNTDLVRSIGADHVINYKSREFTKEDAGYNIVVDNAGTARWSRVRHILKPKGRLIIISGSLLDVLFGGFHARLGGRRVIGGVSSESSEVVRNVVEIATSGGLHPVIDQTYGFDQMAEAHRYIDTGRKRGNVVVALNSDR
ncbi:NAD(P)-dependent alcohol dehydrogenase [Ruegeria sp. A3M17]|uniref:NAD(P)-dependent alcohol dehydrogenase n=1 Tax=Ruegeria sp. A3M17 TaxID=2267229 RepID=UPI000DE88F53|nr:NAD(P)-dependent alcohol dehydrogenase [Ruegeria sp. A3M17]RBW52573.1 NAD(P)-dependent alcohol dehydrogenase [Ruegeria sp. A3M17]